MGARATFYPFSFRFKAHVSDGSNASSASYSVTLSTCSVIRLLLIAFPASSVNAEQPSRKRCVAVSKSEVNGALEGPFPLHPYERRYLRSRLDHPPRLTQRHCHRDRSPN